MEGFARRDKIKLVFRRRAGEWISSEGSNDPAFLYHAVLFSKAFAAEYEFSLNMV